MNRTKENIYRHKFKFQFIDLVRPNFPCWFDFEKALLIWQWMGTTAKPYYKYGKMGPNELLLGGAGVGAQDAGCLIEDGHRYGVKGRLHRVFQNVLLNSTCSESAERWKQDQGIDLGASKIITATWLDLSMTFEGRERGKWYGVCFEDRVRSFLKLPIYQSYVPDLLTVQLNRCHDKARSIQAIRLGLTREGRFKLDLGYGYPRDSSSWDHELCVQQENEPLCDFVRRWDEAIEAVTGPLDFKLLQAAEQDAREAERRAGRKQ